MSATDALHELFTPYHDAVEIGFLTDEAAWDRFLSLTDGRPWGLHFPRMRDPRRVANQLSAASTEDRAAAAAALREDVAAVKEAGGSYVLVHFPYFPSAETPHHQVREHILWGIDILHQIQETLDIPLVTEFKLGERKDPGGIQHVVELGETLQAWLAPFGCCLDVGDWAIAAQALPDAKAVFDLWLQQATHLHVHGVEMLTDHRYLWTPAEPAAQLPGEVWHLRDIVMAFARNQGRWLVCEHTPHLVKNQAQVSAGYRWLQGLLVAAER